MARVLLTSSAERDYKKLPPGERAHIRAVFDGGFAERPFASEFHTRKLQEPLAGYRLRVGEYRVLFEFEDDTIVVYRIRHRKDVYR